jgi:pyridoxal phosphate enzyme (YggS family)
MTTIANALQAIAQRMTAAARAAGRTETDIRLLAVSKTFPAQAIREAAEAGQHAFGESYLQEAMAKMEALKNLDIQWHFIGPIQGNKTKGIAEHFSWVHSVDRAKIADRLSAFRPENLGELQVCIQVNVSGEATKSGVSPKEVLPLAQHIKQLPRLRLRGLMAIPEPTPDIALQRKRFHQVRELFDEMNEAGLGMDTLSMGMSDDMESAIAEGATMIRVGTAIFGSRNYS